MDNNHAENLEKHTKTLLENVEEVGTAREDLMLHLSRYTDLLRDYCLEALSYGCSEASVAKKAHIAVTTLRKWQGKRI